jgi:predicted cobalt transporter CbtA
MHPFLTMVAAVFVGLWLFKIRWLIFAMLIALVLIVAAHAQQLSQCEVDALRSYPIAPLTNCTTKQECENILNE